MRLMATVTGSLFDYLKGRRDALAKEVTSVVNHTATELRDDYRADIKRVFRGTGGGRSRDFSKTVRANLYPGRRPSTNAAGLVYFGASWMRAHVEGTTIRAAGGRWLVIPLPYAEKLGFARKEENRSSFGRFVAGSRAGDANIAKAERKFGPLAPHQINGGRILLVARPKAPVTRRRKGGPARLADGSIPLFLLLPAVRLRARFQIKPAADRALDKLYGRLQSAVDRGLGV